MQQMGAVCLLDARWTHGCELCLLSPGSMSKLGKDLSCQEPLGWAEFKCHYSSFYAPQDLICEQLCQLFGTGPAAMKAPACGVNSSLDL